MTSLILIIFIWDLGYEKKSSEVGSDIGVLNKPVFEDPNGTPKSGLRAKI